MRIDYCCLLYIMINIHSWSKLQKHLLNRNKTNLMKLALDHIRRSTETVRTISNSACSLCMLILTRMRFAPSWHIWTDFCFHSFTISLNIVISPYSISILKLELCVREKSQKCIFNGCGRYSTINIKYSLWTFLCPSDTKLMTTLGLITFSHTQVTRYTGVQQYAVPPTPGGAAGQLLWDWDGMEFTEETWKFTLPNTNLPTQDNEAIMHK
jgi:hypothetical protein